MVITITCQNPHCHHEIGRSEVPAHNVPNYLTEIGRQQILCPQCQRKGPATVATLAEAPAPAPDPAPVAAPASAAPAVTTAPATSVVPDTLPDDIGRPDESAREDDDIDSTDS
jgi:hypothetical protein